MVRAHHERVSILDRSFGPLYWTQFLGAFNDNVLKNALVLLITYRSVAIMGLDAPMLVALSGAIFILPYFFFSPLAGSLADRLDRRDLTRTVKLSEVGLMIFAAMALVAESYVWLLILLFLMGTQSTFFGPLKYGMLRDTVGEGRLAHANALTSAGTFFAILLGTILGGSLAASGALTVLSATLIIVALFGVLSATQVQPVPIHTTGHLVGSFRSLWRLGFESPGLGIRLLSISWFWLLGAVILALLAPLTKDVFHASEWVSTFFLTLFTLGMGLGAALAHRVGRGKAEVGLAAIMGLVMCVTLVDLSFLASTGLEKGEQLRDLREFLLTFTGARMSVSLLVLSTAAGAYIVPLMTSLQLMSEPDKISRVIAANNIANAVFMVVGSILLMAFLSLNFSYAKILLIFAALNLIASTAVYAAFSKYTVKLWIRFLTPVFFKIRLEGQEHFPKEGPFIVVSNHVSFIDWLLLMSLSPKPIRFVIDHNYYYAPGMPFWLRQAGLIPIAMRKENPALMERAFDEVSRALQEGDVVGIFPEGALTRTGELRAFQAGLMRIVERDPVPVVVVCLKGVWGSFFSHSAPGLFRKTLGLRRRVFTARALVKIPGEQVQLREIHRLIQNELARSASDEG
jgi:1-acyl-sn-glycerol-3-phosphate acyltransferase